jgi:hypothetical protein
MPWEAYNSPSPKRIVELLSLGFAAFRVGWISRRNKFPANFRGDHAEITMARANSWCGRGVIDPARRIGGNNDCDHL